MNARARARAAAAAGLADTRCTACHNPVIRCYPDQRMCIECDPAPPTLQQWIEQQAAAGRAAS